MHRGLLRPLVVALVIASVLSTAISGHTHRQSSKAAVNGMNAATGDPSATIEASWPQTNSVNTPPTGEPSTKEPVVTVPSAEPPPPSEPTTEGPTSTAESTATLAPSEPVEPTVTEEFVTPDPTQTDEPAAANTESSESPTPSAVLGSPTASAPMDGAGLEQTEETLTILKVDEQGEPLTDGQGGACFYVAPVEWTSFCDGHDGASDGVIQVTLALGEYNISESRAPTGYGPAEPRQVMIVAGGPNEITVVNEPRPILTIHKVNEDGEPLTDDQGGACFELTSSEGWRVACDGDDGASDGMISIIGTVGTYMLTETRAPDGYILGYSKEITLVGGPNEITVSNLPPESLTIHKVDENGEPLTDASGGACFEMVASEGCDGDDGANDGTITLLAPVGTYTLRETRAPDGYLLPPLQQITIAAGGPNEVTVVNLPAETVTLHKVDENGEPLLGEGLGVCFQLGSDPASRACDANDGANDGTITLLAAPGTYSLDESNIPLGYFRVESKQVTVVPGGPNEFTVVNVPYPTLTIFKVDENGEPVTDAETGACFEAEFHDTFACDSDDGANDGTIKLPVPPGWVYLTEPHAPAGYGTTFYSTYVFMNAEGSNEVTIANVKLQPLTVYKVGEDGAPLTDSETGACFELYESLDEDEYYPPVAGACDADDGANDGTITLPAVYPAFYWLVETRAPDGHAAASAQQVRIVAGGPNEITVPNQRLQSLTVHLVDELGNPLTDEEFPLCLVLSTGLDETGEFINSFVACDRADGANDGTFVFPDIPPGTYWMVQYRTIDGYAMPEPHQITVAVGGPTEITEINAYIGGEPSATVTAAPATVPPETAPPGSPTATGVAGVLELPSTGAGANAGAAGSSLLFLTGATVWGLFLMAVWRRRRTHLDR